MLKRNSVTVYPLKKEAIYLAEQYFTKYPQPTSIQVKTDLTQCS